MHLAQCPAAPPLCGRTRHLLGCSRLRRWTPAESHLHSRSPLLPLVTQQGLGGGDAPLGVEGSSELANATTSAATHLARRAGRPFFCIKMALMSCTKLSVGLMAVYVAYVSWTMYMLFCPSRCDDSMDPSRCIAPLHNGDSDYQVSSLQCPLLRARRMRAHATLCDVLM